jgi:hypothetical protein
LKKYEKEEIEHMKVQEEKKGTHEGPKVLKKRYEQMKAHKK